MDQKSNKDNLKVANRYYQPEDYKKKDELSSGLATTHEQVSDTWTEGEIQPVIDDVNGEDIPIERKGYDK
ncbi:YozQ family protein [Cytobacillus sp. FJAT-54145]|uniref:YozQ family protein n=1 Tax=Cytobacillus spartinae TaxID=3299023 RepID=A0ABW6K7B6_9BACI